MIFHRLREADKTFIRGDPNQKCKNIMGLDTNALYLYYLGQEMPVTNFIHRRMEHSFIVEKHEQYISQYV